MYINCIFINPNAFLVIDIDSVKSSGNNNLQFKWSSALTRAADTQEKN